MRKYKFRGETLGGATIFGDLIHRQGKTYIDLAEPEYEVKPESIAQFLGYDKNGAEVYDGDGLICRSGYWADAYLCFKVEDTGSFRLGDTISYGRLEK